MKLHEMFDESVKEMKSGKPSKPRGINIKTNVDALQTGMWVDKQPGGAEKQKNADDIKNALEKLGLKRGFDFILKRGKDGKVIVHIAGTVDKDKQTAAFSLISTAYQDIKEADPKSPARSDKVQGIMKGYDKDEDETNYPSPRRKGQRAGRYLRRTHGLGGAPAHAADLQETGEEEGDGEIKSRDPRITAMLKKARVQYAGAAADDLSALVSMMNDEQTTQDRELDDLDQYNGSQDVEIDHEEGVNNDQAIELGDLAARIAKLENDRAPSRDTNEAIVPDENGEYYDDETGEIFSPDKIEKKHGKYKEKVQEPEPMQYEPDDDDDYDFTPPSTGSTKSMGGIATGRAIAMFGDIAAGGGDPIDHLMIELGMDMDAINALAREQGYSDAYEWAESYAQNEMESIISNANKLNNR